MARSRSWLARLFRPNSPVRLGAQRPPRFRPQLETLEDRLAPASFVVTSTADIGAGTLRAAVNAANAAGGSNTITIAPAIAGQTITLASKDTDSPFAFGPTDLVIGIGTPPLGPSTDNLTILGDPTSGITISGGGSTRIFGVLGGSTLTIQYVTLTGGSVTGGKGGGSAANPGDVPGGGGAGMGGAIFVAQGGTLNVVQSLLTGNTATGGMGGGAGVSGPRQGGAGGGSAAYAGGNLSGVGVVNGANAGGGGVAGPGQPNVGQIGGAGGLNEQGGNAAAQPAANAAGNSGTLGGGGGGAGSYGVNGGSGVSVSSGGFGGGGGGSWGQPNTVGTGGFGGGGGSGFRGGGAGGFGGGAGSSWDGTSFGPGFGGGRSGGSGNQWGNGAGGGAGMGGAIFNNGGTVNFINSTLAGNSATGGAGGTDGAGASGQAGSGGSGFGGAIFNRNGTVTILNSTIANNTVTAGAAGAGTNVAGAAGTSGGGGVYNLSDGAGGVATLNLTNSIVSGSIGPSDIVNSRNNPGAGSSATINATAPNIVQAAIVTQNGAVTNGAGVMNVNPQLGALANNGGPTQTLLPAAGSPALGTGTVAGAPSADQRTFPRPTGGPIDLGSVQVTPTASTTTLVSSVNPSVVGQSVTFTATVTLASSAPISAQGTITFFDGGTALTTVALVNGSASFSTTTLTVGSHPITAQYNPAAEFPVTTSTSAPLNQVVTTNPSSTTLVSSVNPSAGGQGVTFTATVTLASNLFGAAQGTITFLDGTTTLATVTLVNGSASFSTSTLTIGSHPITAVYTVTPGFPTVASTSAPLIQVVTAPAASIFVTGTDAGVVTTVQVFNANTHALITSFLPFGPGFFGGARVATGDLNGDGVQDIVVGAGPGGGPEVNVYDGTTFKLVTTFFAFVPVSAFGSSSAVINNAQGNVGGPFFAFLGGVYVAVGDINGDGLDDIIVGAGQGGGPQVQVFDGRNFSLLANFYAFGGPNFAGGVRVAAGDVTGSGHADIICGAGPGGSPQVTIYDGKTFQAVGNFIAFNAPNFRGGVFVSAAVVSLNLRDAIVVSAGAGGGPQVTVYDGITLQVLSSFFAFSPQFTGGVRVAPVDLNNSFTAALAVVPGRTGGPLVEFFDSQTLNLLTLFFVYPPTYDLGLFLA